jgi:dienelactone hydrolase
MKMPITRRKLLQEMGQLTIASGMSCIPLHLMSQNKTPVSANRDYLPSSEQLAGTEPLTLQGDLAIQMVEGIGKFLLKETAASIGRREGLWHHHFSSRQAYEASVTPHRDRFAKVIGLIDSRVRYDEPEIVDTTKGPEVVANGSGYRVYAVRWPVLQGVEGEGLLLEPSTPPVARVIALPDADWSPEMLVGMAQGLRPEAQFARRLAENSCQVLVPTLINRKDTWSGNSNLNLLTNMTHREFIYRMAYEIGRHIIGYEVQKVLAAVDWFSRSEPARPLGVMGYGEGGLLALYSGAADTRIEAAVVSGYFHSRQDVWEEPLYRNVWTLLQEFGDAELASLIAPRGLIVEASRGPEISMPPSADEHRINAAAPGRLVSPNLEDVRTEVERARPFFSKLGANPRLVLAVSGDEGQGEPGSEQALHGLLGMLGVKNGLKAPGTVPVDQRKNFDPEVRLGRQFNQLVNFTQAAVLGSEKVREQFWSKADTSSVDKWKQTTGWYRAYLWEEILGKLPDPALPITASTRKIYEEPNWTGYEVLLPLWPEVYAYGILLLPRNLAPGERRPVVVCQHGLENRPQDLIKPTVENEHYYHELGADLANHGFVVYCPQNPYIGGEKFRQLQRLANPLKLSLFSFILSQHKRTLDWLGQQPFVDSQRIGFYGLSYGGKTAVRVPPLLDQYCLSICSGDFNEWIWKVSRNDEPFSYVFGYEYEIPDFGIGNYFNYSEMANLMTPRPFMVERGHSDAVSIDPWVAYEYSKVKQHYDHLDLSDRTRIEYFNGPHTIHGVGTIEFLHHFLRWGEPFSS